MFINSLQQAVDEFSIILKKNGFYIGRQMLETKHVIQIIKLTGGWI